MLGQPSTRTVADDVDLIGKAAWDGRIPPQSHRGPSAAFGRNQTGIHSSDATLRSPIPSAQAQTNGGRPFPSSPSVRSTRGRDRRDGDDERGSPRLSETMRGWVGGIAEGPERKGMFSSKTVLASPFRRRLRIGLSPRELEADAKAKAEGAVPSVEPSGGLLGNCRSFNTIACQKSRKKSESSTFVVQK